MFKQLITKLRVRAIYTRAVDLISVNSLLNALAIVFLVGLTVGGAHKVFGVAPTQDPAAPPTRPAHSLDQLLIKKLDKDTQLIIAISDTGSVDIEVIRPMEVTVKR